MNACGPPVRTPGLWAPIIAPYTAQREPLADAEHHLDASATASSHWLWRRLADAAGNDHEVLNAADALLAATTTGWRLEEHDTGPTIVLTGWPDLGSSELAAVQALGLLLESGGARRLKRCRRRYCTAVFLDWTNAGTRQVCRAHGRTLR